VKKIIDKLKGTIQVSSQYGKGTKILVTLPNHQPTN
jgi:signal transduction histidine kinase